MNIEIASRLSAIVDNTAFIFAHQDETVIIELIKAMREDLRRGFDEKSGAFETIEDCLRNIIIKRGEIEARCATVISTSIH